MGDPIPPSEVPAGARGPMAPEDGTAGEPSVFKDFSLPDLLWYVPSLRLVTPQGTEAWQASPFSYAFKRSGHDPGGEPVIDARITLTLREVISDAVRAQILGAPRAAPVRINTMRARMLIPFRDAATGELRTTAVAAEQVTGSGDAHTLVFPVSGELARVVYGSLAHPGFQSVATRLEIEFSFTARRMARVRVRVDDPDDGGNGLEPYERPPHFPRPPRPQPTYVWEMRESTIELGRARVLDAVMPCTQLGRFYVDVTDAARPAEVGCQDAMALGRISHRPYEPLHELATEDYEVFAAQGRPATFLVLPSRYRVARARPGQPGVQAWGPMLRWIQAYDYTHTVALPCRLQAALEPDIGRAQFAALRRALAGRAANPTLLLPTSFGSGVTGFAVTEWNTPVPIQAALSGDAIQLGAALDFASAVMLNAMLRTTAREGRLVGNAAFTLDDGSTLGPVELDVGVARLTGPWPEGPVAVRAAGGGMAVENHAETGATVTGVLAEPADGSVRVLAENLQVPVPSGGSAVIPVEAPAGARLCAVYRLAEATPADIAVEQVYLEDLHTTITVINDVDMDKAGIRTADVSARLAEQERAFTFALTPATPLTQVDLVRPLTGHQNGSPLLHLSAVVHRDGRPGAPTGDYVADLREGAIFHLSDVLATA